MEEERDTINKKTKIMLVIGVSILLVLVISATYAFFAVDATNSTSSTVITGKTEKVGNATLSTLVESLYLNLSATDMAVTNAGKYYATSEEGKDYEPNKSAGYYDLAQLSLTSDEEEDNNIYTCKTTLKITLDKEIADNMVNDLQTGDVIFHTFVNGKNDDYDLSTIKETGSKEIEVEIESVGSNTKNIRGYLEFTNKKEDDQSVLAGKNLKVTIETKGLSCEVTGKAVEADKEKIKAVLKSKFEDCGQYREILFVDYISLNEADFTEDISADGEPAESVMLWIKDGIIYIGSNDRIIIKDMSNLFKEDMSLCQSIKKFDLGNITFDRTTNMLDALGDDYPGLTTIIFPSRIDTSKVTDMSSLMGHNYITSLNLSSFDTSNVTDMSGMFYGLYDLTELDISNFDTSKVTDMSNMFANSSNLNSLDLSNFDTSKVTNMSYMFAWTLINELNLSSFDTSNVQYMSYMFDSTNVTELDLSNFDTSKVTDMDNMFAGCSNLKYIDMRKADFKAVIDNYRYPDISNCELIVKDEKQKELIEPYTRGVTIKIAGQE